MNVLGLDTATTACSAAVWRDGRIAASRRLTMSRGQAEALLPLVMETLAAAGLDGPAALDRIAVTVGPGAFTGLRIALAAARGFAVALDLPVVGITTFDAIAHAVPAAERQGRRLLVAVDSRRAEPWVQLYDADLTPLGEPAAPAPADIAAWLPPGPLLAVGDGLALLRDHLAGRADIAFAVGDGLPDAAVAAALGAQATPPFPIARPLYLRPPDVSLPKPRGAAEPKPRGAAEPKPRGANGR